MASSPSSKKRIRQNLKRRARNRWRKRTLKDALKAFEDKLVHGEVAEAQTALRTACQILDRTAQRGVIHRNTASRKKSRLSARMKTRQATPTTAPVAKSKKR
jgi:small subunit ribosomal protein S20